MIRLPIPSKGLDLEPKTPRASEYLVFYVNGKPRTVRRDWFEKLRGPLPPAGYSCNGCTASPDMWMGYDLWPVCIVHDYHYDPNGPDISKKEADEIFRENLITFLDLQGCPWWRRDYVAFTYWKAVTKLGWVAYKGYSWQKVASKAVELVPTAISILRRLR